MNSLRKKLTPNLLVKINPPNAETKHLSHKDPEKMIFWKVSPRFRIYADVKVNT